jgi:hypothetical protein
VTELVRLQHTETDNEDNIADNTMNGKVCLVTGATSGIGAETAKQLARLGATVILVGRSADKSAGAVAWIKQHTGNAAVGFLLFVAVRFFFSLLNKASRTFVDRDRILRYDHAPKPVDPISITRAEYDAVCDRRASKGIPIKPDREKAWRDFAGWRVNYDTVLLALCEITVAPPAPWSSDRSQGTLRELRRRR